MQQGTVPYRCGTAAAQLGTGHLSAFPPVAKLGRAEDRQDGLLLPTVAGPSKKKKKRCRGFSLKRGTEGGRGSKHADGSLLSTARIYCIVHSLIQGL
ncbi:hypothetical protein GQ53DRAFT_244171 [Thozetella sp. PMI_491]|nr:hypothetical protein GQ53DRAFT_244171 [Thozetella sp. PMI_491]